MREERRDFWQRKITDFKVSGKSAAGYCRDNNIKCTTFYKWIRKFRKETLSSVKQSKFDEVRVAATPAQDLFLINIGNLKRETLCKIIKSITE